MTPEQARALARELNAAADAADAAGRAEVDVIVALRAADDKARAELQAAIEASGAARQ